MEKEYLIKKNEEESRHKKEMEKLDKFLKENDEKHQKFMNKLIEDSVKK